MMRWILMVALVTFAGLTDSTDAGVRGGHFEGSLQFDTGGTDPIQVKADFDAVGNGFSDQIAFDEEFFPAAPGTYTELDLFIISIWSAEYDAPFEPGQASGISLFGILSTYRIVNAGNHTPDASGIVFRTGPAAD